jgi:putative polymerase
MLRFRAPRLTALALVLAASTYTIGLCALYTLGAPVTNGLVAAADALVILCALGLIAWARPDSLIVPALALAANFLIIAFFSEGVELKSLRDVMLICAFLMLGRAAGDFAAARTAFFAVAGLAIGLGLVEFLWPHAFVQLFNVLRFYVMRGEVTSQAAQYVDSSLFVSGMRNGERALVPGLGAHRVSSIFLEPVSMGNFGAIAIAFALATAKQHWRSALAAAAVGALAIIMADARFAAFAALVFVLGRMVPPRWRLFLLAPMPVIAMAFLMIMAEFVSPAGDDLPSRLSISGRAIAGLDTGALFGLSPGGRETLDSGYAYVLTSFGLPFCALLWVGFLALPERGPQSSAFKFLIGLYICALLCVSGSSLFALKTGGLLWFLLGSLMAEEGAGLLMPNRLLARPISAPIFLRRRPPTLATERGANVGEFA